MNNDFDFIKDKFDKASQPVPYSLDKSIINSKIQNKESKVVKMKRMNFKALAGVALCAVVLVAGIVGGQSISAKTDIVANNPTVSRKANEYLSTLTGGVLIAYANDEGVRETKPLELGAKTPLEYSLEVIDTRGWSEKEIQDKLNELRKTNMKYADSINIDGADTIRFGTELKDNVIIRKAIVNTFSIKADPSQVKSVRLQNKTDYWKLVYHDLREDVELQDSFIKGNDLFINSDDFEAMMIACKNINGRDYFEINLDHDMPLCDAIDKNPDIDLSTFDDTLTFTVEYKDGTKAVSVINIGLDKDGNLIAQAI